MHYVLIKLLCYVKTEYEYVLFIYTVYTLEGIITQKAALLRSNFDSSCQATPELQASSLLKWILKMTEHAAEFLLSLNWKDVAYTGESRARKVLSQKNPITQMWFSSSNCFANI